MRAERGCSPPGIREQDKAWILASRGRGATPDGWPWSRVRRVRVAGTSGEAFLQGPTTPLNGGHCWLRGSRRSGRRSGVRGTGPTLNSAAPRNWKGVFLYPQTRISPRGTAPLRLLYTQEVWSRNSFFLNDYPFLSYKKSNLEQSFLFLVVSNCSPPSGNQCIASQCIASVLCTWL